jgi:hypothetical protein
MNVVMTRSGGLDVHQATVVATIRVPDDDGGRRIVTETFGTMTPDLLALRAWLHASGVTHVALESTGVYWRPVSSRGAREWQAGAQNWTAATRIRGAERATQYLSRQSCAGNRHGTWICEN